MRMQRNNFIVITFENKSYSRILEMKKKKKKRCKTENTCNVDFVCISVCL